MTASVSQWNAKQVLNIDTRSSCVGLTKAHKRCGQCFISNADRHAAEVTLQTMSGQDVQSANFDSQLRTLAICLLCPRWHKGKPEQVSSKVRHWKRTIESFCAAEDARQTVRPRTVISRTVTSGTVTSRSVTSRVMTPNIVAPSTVVPSIASSSTVASSTAASSAVTPRAVTPSTVGPRTATPGLSSNTTIASTAIGLAETLESLRREIVKLNERYTAALQLASAVQIVPSEESPQFVRQVNSAAIPPMIERSTPSEGSSNAIRPLPPPLNTSEGSNTASTIPVQVSPRQEAIPNPVIHTPTSPSVSSNDEATPGSAASEHEDPADGDQAEQLGSEASVQGFSRQPLEGDCCIYHEEVDNGTGLPWCRRQCGQTFHAECPNHWLASEWDAGQTATCPYWSIIPVTYVLVMLTFSLVFVLNGFIESTMLLLALLSFGT